MSEIFDKYIELEKEKIKLQRQVSVLKQIIKSLYQLKNKKIEQPIYTLNPSYQLMRTMAFTEEIDDEEILIEIERKLEVHKGFLK